MDENMKRLEDEEQVDEQDGDEEIEYQPGIDPERRQRNDSGVLLFKIISVLSPLLMILAGLSVFGMSRDLMPAGALSYTGKVEHFVSRSAIGIIQAVASLGLLVGVVGLMLWFKRGRRHFDGDYISMAFLTLLSIVALGLTVWHIIKF